MLVITTKSQNFRNKGDLSSSLISLSMHLRQLNANKEASNEKFFCNYILSLLLLSLFIPATETFSQNFQGSLLPQGHLQMLYFVETFIGNSTDLEHAQSSRTTHNTASSTDVGCDTGFYQSHSIWLLGHAVK